MGRTGAGEVTVAAYGAPTVEPHLLSWDSQFHEAILAVSRAIDSVASLQVDPEQVPSAAASLTSSSSSFNLSGLESPHLRSAPYYFTTAQTRQIDCQ